MEHDEFGLRTLRRIRASDKRRETGRHGNTGGEVKYEVGRPHGKSQAAVATQHTGCTEVQASQQKQSGKQQKTLLAASRVRSRSMSDRCQMIRRRLTCNDEVETKCDIDEAESQDHVGVRRSA